MSSPTRTGGMTTFLIPGPSPPWGALSESLYRSCGVVQPGHPDKVQGPGRPGVGLIGGKLTLQCTPTVRSVLVLEFTMVYLSRPVSSVQLAGLRPGVGKVARVGCVSGDAP